MRKTLSSLFGADTKAFSMSLAEQLAKRYPPAIDGQAGKRPSINRITRITQETCDRASEYQAKNRLGWIGKAWLANNFRWALTDLGYTKEFVEFATEAVVVHISNKKS